MKAKIFKTNQLEETENILNLIDSLKVKFNEEIYPKYNKDNQEKPLFRDAESFYCCGHCPSFARILYEIFEGNCTFYEDFTSESLHQIGHAIVKIGKHFYDASGIVDFYIERYPDNWKECDSEFFPFYEEFYCSKHEHNDEIEQELIQFGKKQLLEFQKNHNDNVIRKLVTKVPTENII